MKYKIKIMVLSTFYLFLGFGLLLEPIYAQDNIQKPSNSNVKIFVEYRLAKDNLLKDGNIQVKVSDNKIVLTGSVPTLFDKSLAADETQKVEDSYIVINKIQVVSSNFPSIKIIKAVQKRIYNNVFYGIFDWVTVQDTNGIVTLNGWVHLPWYVEQFQREAEKVKGVKKIVNNIKPTFGPGRIGIRAARLIYNDPEFEGMEYLANPPIHIIVNNGRVLLEGNVMSTAQGAWAENLVRFYTDAVSVRNNLYADKD